MNAILICTHSGDEYQKFKIPEIKTHIKILKFINEKLLIVLYICEKNIQTITNEINFEGVKDIIYLYHDGAFSHERNFQIQKDVNIFEVNCSSEANNEDRLVYENLFKSDNLEENFDIIWEKYKSKSQKVSLIEKKLELLHSLLIPSQNLKSDYINYPQWKNLISTAKYKVDSTEYIAWIKFNEQVKEKHDLLKEKIDNEYTAALRNLRDELLD